MGELLYTDRMTLVCFYSIDRTPCCGRERVALCDKLKVLWQAGVGVVGVTLDSGKQHERFAEHCSVQFPMIRDDAYKHAKRFGVLVQKTKNDKTYHSVLSSAFLISASGEQVATFASFDLEHQALSVLDTITHGQAT